MRHISGAFFVMINNMKLKPVIVLVAIAVIIIFVFSLFSTGKSNNEQVTPNVLNYIHEATVGQTHILVDYATTSLEWTTGLSGQKSLATNQGLLFVFDHPDYYGIWMKDMNFPIDVIWFDINKQIIYIKEDFLPSTYLQTVPQTVYPPSKVGYVLEVPVGFVKNNQIKIGDSISF